MKRRGFIALLGGTAAWPVAAHAQQAAMPVIGFLDGRSPDALTDRLRGFRQGLKDTGYVEGENVVVVYRWAENQFDRLTGLADDLVRRQVNVIVASGGVPAISAAKAATSTLPVVFIVGDDPVRLGVVPSLARPGGNLTGVNFFNIELVAKRLRLLHELVPKAVRVAVLLNPANASVAEFTLRVVQEVAPSIGLQIQILHAASIDEIDAAFATVERDRPDALFVTGDAFFGSRATQFATLTARSRIPATYSLRDIVAAGGLMSYGTDFTEAFRQVGIYTGKILKGAKPSDLPVTQSTKFELVINLQTARSLGIEVPPGVLSIADEVIE